MLLKFFVKTLAKKSVCICFKMLTMMLRLVIHHPKEDKIKTSYTVQCR